jgi:hypothetical protein
MFEYIAEILPGIMNTMEEKEGIKLISTTVTGDKKKLKKQCCNGLIQPKKQKTNTLRKLPENYSNNNNNNNNCSNGTNIIQVTHKYLIIILSIM